MCADAARGTPAGTIEATINFNNDIGIVKSHLPSGDSMPACWNMAEVVGSSIMFIPPTRAPLPPCQIPADAACSATSEEEHAVSATTTLSVSDCHLQRSRLVTYVLQDDAVQADNDPHVS